MESAKAIFRQHLRDNGMFYSEQREQILDTFLKTERHLTINDLYDLIREESSKIGIATVYRTMKVICQAGLARETDFGGNIRRFEHKHEHQHHDHLICNKCGKIIEFMSPEIEKLQENLAEKHKFTVFRHRMEIYGICKTCKSK